ncbi:MAG: SPOR domain-containing protein [Desulfobacterales bacterium]|nr:MAG: SPOR domain-containing protein [Desulfobacterales bacterium]
MNRKKKKASDHKNKKPTLVLTRRGILGWLGIIFFVSAWMFVIGVLVGRGTAPVKFDIDKLQKKLEASTRALRKNDPRSAPDRSGGVQDETGFDFYEALKNAQEDVKPLSLQQLNDGKNPLPSKVSKANSEESGAELGPDARQGPPPPAKGQATIKPESAASGRVYIVQAASVRNPKDADRLVARLKKGGYPAYRERSEVAGKGIWYRVRMGEYKSKTEARRTLDRLRKEGLKPILLQR